MKETEALVRLQQIDLTLMRHRRTLNNMPQMKRIQAARAARKKLASQITQIVGQRKDAQMDLDDNESGRRRLEEIYLEVQEKYESGEAGHREVQNLEDQLTSLAKRMEKYEFKHRGLAQRLEKTQLAERNARAMDDRLAREEQSLAENLRSQTSDIQRDVSMLTRERSEVVQSITPEVMSRYEPAFKRFGGLAVETMRGSTPSVCRVAIPPSSFGDIRRGAAITECPYCHRILVTDGMFDLED